MTLLSAGFRAWGGFNTIDVNMRSTTSLNLPRGLFEFMKLGMNSSNSVYEMDDLGISSNNYAEIALGHSRQINDKLNVGGKLKFLLGLGNVNIKMTDMKVQMAEDKWMVQANGEMNTSVKGLTIPTKEESGKEIKIHQKEIWLTGITSIWTVPVFPDSVWLSTWEPLISFVKI